MRISILALAALLPLSLIARHPTDTDLAQPLERIAFGSCNRSTLEQPLWEPILAEDPDLWLWLGDNIYADTEDMELMASMYADQQTKPGYDELRETVPVLGIWDDHDYGENNSGKWYPKREESSQLLLDFFDFPGDHPARQREGIYTTWTFGSGDQETRLILLDTRFFADRPGADSDILGETQWAWLEEILEESTAQIHLIASGIQFLPVDHRYEKWANFPKSRARLFRLISDHAVPGVVLISGDRHIGEISLLNSEAVPYPIYEMTSSGLTHSWKTNPGERNRLRAAPMARALNYGLITIDWEAADPTIELALKGIGGQLHSRVIISQKTLQPVKDLER